MSLYHVNYGKTIAPDEMLEKNKFIQLAIGRLDPRSFDKLCRIISEQIASSSPSQASALTFTKLAILLGYQSSAPTRDANYAWEMVSRVAKGHPKNTNYVLGSLTMMLIARDPRQWVCVKQETGKIDPIEGEEMMVTVYWIKP